MYMKFTVHVLVWIFQSTYDVACHFRTLQGNKLKPGTVTQCTTYRDHQLVADFLYDKAYFILNCVYEHMHILIDDIINLDEILL